MLVRPASPPGRSPYGGRAPQADPAPQQRGPARRPAQQHRPARCSIDRGAPGPVAGGSEGQHQPSPVYGLPEEVPRRRPGHQSAPYKQVGRGSVLPGRPGSQGAPHGPGPEVLTVGLSGRARPNSQVRGVEPVRAHSTSPGLVVLPGRAEAPPRPGLRAENMSSPVLVAAAGLGGRRGDSLLQPRPQTPCRIVSAGASGKPAVPLACVVGRSLFGFGGVTHRPRGQCQPGENDVVGARRSAGGRACAAALSSGPICRDSVIRAISQATTTRQCT